MEPCLQQRNILAALVHRWKSQNMCILTSLLSCILSPQFWHVLLGPCHLLARRACCYPTGYGSPAEQAQLLSVQHRGAHSGRSPAQEVALPSYSWHMTGLLGALATHTHPAESGKLHAQLPDFDNCGVIRVHEDACCRLCRILNRCLFLRASLAVLLFIKMNRQVTSW